MGLLDYKKLWGSGFRFMGCPCLCEQTNRIRFSVKPRQFTSIVYAIVINGKVKYIGITKDFWKRTDTYRNAKYWSGAFPSNKKKTAMLEGALKRDWAVEFYCVPCDSPELEVDMIRKFNPPWNKVQSNKGYSL